MKANKAIEKLKIKQEEMMREANRMAMRAEKLRSIVEFQDNPYDEWEVVGLSIQDLQAYEIVLKHASSGIIIHSNELKINLQIHDEHDTRVNVAEYIGGEEE